MVVFGLVCVQFDYPLNNGAPPSFELADAHQIKLRKFWVNGTR